MSATMTLGPAVTDENGYIQDGCKFLSDNGTKCYKLPKKVYDAVKTYATAEFQAKLASFEVERLEKAKAWALARLKETEGFYVILPVRTENKKTAYGQYKKDLYALLRAVQVELVSRGDNAFAE